MKKWIINPEWEKAPYELVFRDCNGGIPVIRARRFRDDEGKDEVQREILVDDDNHTKTPRSLEQ